MIVRDEAPLSPALAACVGEAGEPWVWEVTSTAIRAHARAVGFARGRYYDVARARAEGLPHLPAPPGFIGLPAYLPGATDEVFGQPSRGQVHVPHDFDHVVEVGTTLEHLAPLHAGDELVGTAVIAEIRELRSARGVRGVRVTRVTTLVRGETPVARETRVTLYAERLPW